MRSIVTVLVPVHDGADLLSTAVESVLDQDVRDLELLVVDDGSTDETADVVERHAGQDRRVRFLRNARRLGIQTTLNRGLRAATGRYVARLDHDDEWVDPSKLRCQLGFLERNPDHVLLGTGTIVVDESGDELYRFLVPSDDSKIRSGLLKQNRFICSSTMFRRATALACGGYDESPEAKHVEDYDLWLRLGTRGKLANLPRFAVQFRIRSEGLSGSHQIAQCLGAMRMASRYRAEYPGYRSALLRGAGRLLLYGICGMPPIASWRRFLPSRQ